MSKLTGFSRLSRVLDFDGGGGSLRLGSGFELCCGTPLTVLVAASGRFPDRGFSLAMVEA